MHRRPSCENRWRDRHYSGPGVATTARCYLPANSAEPRQRWPTWYCCAQRLPVSPRSLRNLGGYRVSSLRLNVWLAPAGTRLRGFPDRTPLVAEDDLTRLCCSDPHLAVGSRWLLRCPVQSGRSSSARFPIRHQRRSGVLHGADYRADAAAPSQIQPKARQTLAQPFGVVHHRALHARRLGQLEAAATQTMRFAKLQHCEGGGQILRTGLAVSMATGRPLCIQHIRVKHPRPGLTCQHQACVQTQAGGQGHAGGDRAFSFSRVRAAQGQWRKRTKTPAGRRWKRLRSISIWPGPPRKWVRMPTTTFPFKRLQETP